MFVSVYDLCLCLAGEKVAHVNEKSDIEGSSLDSLFIYLLFSQF